MKKDVLATIEETETIAPEVMKINNSKYAVVSFVIDNKKYVSENSIQIPIRYQVGDKIKVKYEVENPNKVHTKHLFTL